MARRSSSSLRWRYLNPSYYLKRPTRLAFLFIAFVVVTFAVWDRQSLLREHEEEVSKLSEQLSRLQDQLRNTDVASGVNDKDPLDLDPVNNQRREKVKKAMLHAWNSYEKYAWGQDELEPQSKKGVNSFGGLGATLVDSLDTLYIMGLEDEFRKAREWVATNLDFNKDYEASVFETTIRLHYKGDSILADSGSEQLEFIALSQRTGDPKYQEKAENVIRHIKMAFPLDGLLPIFINPHTGIPNPHSVITFGAMGDSFYEYLLKAWIQGNKTETVKYYRFVIYS